MLSKPISSLQAEYDLVIVGSGGGSMCAALAAKDQGKHAVILEKQAKVGGSTAYTGGVWWIPNNPLMHRAGVPDSLEKARQYLDSVVTYHGPGSSKARREVYLKVGPEMVLFLERQGMKFRRPAEPWPDYYDDLPGGSAESRSLLAEHFDRRKLGDWGDRLARYPPAVGVPMGADEYPVLLAVKTTWAGKRKALKFTLARLKDRLTGAHTMTGGAAIQGRMLDISLRAGIEIYPVTPVTDFIVDDGRVVGVRATHDGRSIEVRARDGVLVNAGGFSRSQLLRDKYGRQPASSEWTSANLGDTGDLLEAMLDLGAATDCLDTAWWVITSRNLSGDWPAGAVHSDGLIYPFMHHLDLSFPHCIMVDQTGQRYCNEAGSYMEIGERMYEREKELGMAIPSWTVFDSRHRKRYPWGAQLPGVTPDVWIESGYMKKADTLEELARECGIDPAGLVTTAEQFNGFCRKGKDDDFNRGGRAFDRAHGDPSVRPNPNLGSIETGPFYAVAMYPGDVGTAGGVVTDEFGRVLRDDGSPIEGLYATGNTTASVVGRTYPGAGASIGASFIFAYLAALHSARSNDLDRLLA